MRVLAVLTVVLDLVAVPSLLVMVSQHTLHVLMPWTAWGRVLTHAAWRQHYVLVALALLAGALYWGYHLGPGGGSADTTTAFGSARWRTPRELAQSLDRWTATARTNPAGLVVGAGSTRGRVREAWVNGRDGHNILIGAPGAGKTLKVILPSIAVIADAGENLVITDPKGELHAATAEYLAQHGYRVATLDLRFPERSLRWNPLDAVSQAMAEQRWSDAVRVANDLANLLAAQGAPGGENGAFWQSSARSIGAALALLVADQAPPEARHLASVYHVLTQSGPALDGILQALPPTHPARQAYGPVLTSAPETRQNQLNVVAVSLSLFADPNIAWLTGGSTFRPEDLTAPRTAVFVVVPDDTSTYYPLAALFVTQVMQTLARAAAARPGGKLAVPVHLVLDEFGNLPKIPEFDKALTVARGRGIRVTLTVQHLAQLDERYGPKTAETMRGSCNTWVYLSANDPETARIVSDKVGQTTIETTSRGTNWQTGSRQWSENTSATGRALLPPDEVMRWKPDHTLVLQMGQLPAKLPARYWTDWPQAQGGLGPDERAYPPIDSSPPPLWTPPGPDASDDALTFEPVVSLDAQVPSWRARP